MSKKEKKHKLIARVEELERICAEAYQVVGVLADANGRFDDEDVIRILDNLSSQKLIHQNVLPFFAKKEEIAVSVNVDYPRLTKAIIEAVEREMKREDLFCFYDQAR